MATGYFDRINQMTRQTMPEYPQKRYGHWDHVTKTNPNPSPIGKRFGKNWQKTAILIQCTGCAQCKKVLPKGARKTQRFCSDKCRNDWWYSHQGELQGKRLTAFVCTVCGKAFTSYTSCLSTHLTRLVQFSIRLAFMPEKSARLISLTRSETAAPETWRPRTSCRSRRCVAVSGR